MKKYFILTAVCALAACGGGSGGGGGGGYNVPGSVAQMQRLIRTRAQQPVAGMVAESCMIWKMLCFNLRIKNSAPQTKTLR